MLKKIDYLKASECLRTIAHPDRLKMIQLLLKNKLTVGQIARECNMQPHVASEHLRIMKDRQLFESEKKGREVFYTVKEKALSNILKCIENKFKN